MSVNTSDVEILRSSQLSEDAIRYLKKNKAFFIQQFAGDRYPSVKNPISLFMAGSPGAGKTEFSKSLIRVLEETGEKPIVRIDADEIKSHLPGYHGSNAPLFHGASSIGVDKLYDYVLEKNKNFILDGTSSNADRAVKNIERSIKKNRKVRIVYVYQDPEVSWRFVKARERQEGRVIPKNAFIEEFLGARNTVIEVKKRFDNHVHIWLRKHNLEKPYDSPLFITNVDNIDDYIPNKYSSDEISRLLT